MGEREGGRERKGEGECERQRDRGREMMGEPEIDRKVFVWNLSNILCVCCVFVLFEMFSVCEFLYGLNLC